MRAFLPWPTSVADSLDVSKSKAAEKAYGLSIQGKMDFNTAGFSCIICGLFRVTVAQLVEHGTHKPRVAGSIPARDTIKT